jgi:hypothetical protein
VNEKNIPPKTKIAKCFTLTLHDPPEVNIYPTNPTGVSQVLRPYPWSESCQNINTFFNHLNLGVHIGPRPPPVQYPPMTHMILLTLDYLILSMSTCQTICIHIICTMCDNLGVLRHIHGVGSPVSPYTTHMMHQHITEGYI